MSLLVLILIMAGSYWLACAHVLIIFSILEQQAELMLRWLPGKKLYKS